MISADRKETITSEKLLVCKFDHTTRDIFIYLSEKGLHRLRYGTGERLLRFQHQQTGAIIEVLNDPFIESGGEFEVVSYPPNQPQEGYRVVISDRLYGKLKKHPEDPFIDRWGGGSKVIILVDDEMVEMLTV